MPITDQTPQTLCFLMLLEKGYTSRSLKSQKEAILHSQVYQSEMTIFDIFCRTLLGILKTPPSKQNFQNPQLK